MIRPKTDRVIDEFSARIRDALGPALVRIYWFGSRARGEAKAGSDYDLLLETTHRLTEEERDRVADVAVDISADYGVLLDIHERTSEVMKQKRPFSLFTSTVLEEGLSI